MIYSSRVGGGRGSLPTAPKEEEVGRWASKIFYSNRCWCSRGLLSMAQKRGRIGESLGFKRCLQQPVLGWMKIPVDGTKTEKVSRLESMLLAASCYSKSWVVSFMRL